MRFVTYQGVSIEKLSTELLQEFLVVDLEINDCDGYQDPIVVVRRQIEIELLARSLGFK